ncbi:MAG: TetR/AcrR family transcriptional regulator [Desulfomonilaceae bacterium]
MNRWERRKQETRKKIVNIAMDLFRKQGFGATSMEQIAEEVDIAKGTLYSYFNVKEAIVSEYIEQSLKESEPEVDGLLQNLPDTRSRLVAVAEKAAAWIVLHKDILQIYITYRLQNLQEEIKDRSKRSELENAFAKIIIAGQDSGDLRTDIRGEILAKYLNLMHGAAVMSWLLDQVNNPLLDSLSKAYDLFLRGACADPSR